MRNLLYISLIAMIAGGCSASKSNLKPAPSAKGNSAKNQRIVRTVDGVNMTIRADAWTGDQGIKRDVTPLQVTINNNSDTPVAVRFQDFKLISKGGQQYAALPPFQINGSVQKKQMTSPYGGTVNPAFNYSGFNVSPYYGGLYNNIGVYNGYGYGAYDSYYYNSYNDYWTSSELPTKPMLQQALPEGVIDPGGSVKGFIYFEKVKPDKVSRVQFQADLQPPADTKGGNKFGQITIPFTVN